VATAEPLDAEMAERIERHRKERPPSWLTVEEPWDLPKALDRLTDGADTVVVDCVSLWISNRIQREERDEPIVNDLETLADLVADPPFGLILVSNEAGWGGVALTPMGRRFSDLLGSANQRLAAAAGRVVLVVAGVPLTLKEE
jgi:adenosyl cobinamide kinase/adenosyl cobinamide phosphate guanylyltransferase